MHAPNDMKNRFPARKPTMIRLDPELHERIAAVAKAESRSINQQISYYIRLGLEASEKQKAV